MRPTVTDRVACLSVISASLSMAPLRHQCSVAPQSVTIRAALLKRATAEPFETPVGLRTRVSPRNHELDGVHIPHGMGAILKGNGWPTEKATVSCARTAELIEVPFGLRAWMAPRNHVLQGIQTPVQRGKFRGKDIPGHARQQAAMSCEKRLNRSRCRLGC